LGSSYQAMLTGTDVRVVWWRHDEVEQDRLEADVAILSPAERARMSRFRFERDRRTFLASRILLRRTLSAADGRAADMLAFTTDLHGEKPELEGTPPERPLRFSLTHTDGLVACALAWDLDVGVDAEPLSRRPAAPGVIRRVLASAEQAALAALDPSCRDHRFLTSWCVKEAYLKATGTGLRVAPDTVVLDWDTTGHPKLAGDAASQWHVTVAEPAGTHVMALVHRRSAGPPRHVMVTAFQV
jgi:4'-phosphopantetheinyl transferase